MDRPTDSKARLLPAIVATLAALTPAVAVSAPIALAAPPASDEYVLEIPGVRLSPNNSPIESATGSEPGPAAPQQGVVGEFDPPESPLDSMISTIGSAPGALVAGLAAVLALALLTVSFGTRPRADGAR